MPIERRMTLPATAKSAGMARRRLRWLDDLLGVARAQDVRLAISELIANVIRHGEIGPDQDLVLDVRATPAILTVRLRQPTQARDGRLPQAAPAALPEGGWGLMIVERLTDRWGIEPGPPGEVWFEIDLKEA